MKIYVNGHYRDATPEELQAFEQYQPPVEEKIHQLKAKLAEYDYIGVKIAMGVATKEEYRDEIILTENLRNKIRELEEE